MAQTKKIALVMSSVLLMTQMGFADVAKEETAQGAQAQEQVVLKKDKKATDAEALQAEAVADSSADEKNEG